MTTYPMPLESDTVDLRVCPAGTGFLISALAEGGEEIGTALVETGPASRFQGGHGYFIDPGVVHEEGVIAVVSTLEVRCESAGQGVGRALLARAEALAEERGCEAIYVHAANVGRGDPAGFYRACEFDVASADGSYFRKRIHHANQRAGTVDNSWSLCKRLLLSSTQFWVRQCSAAINETNELNRRILNSLLGVR